jgi:hypothetical protein
MAHVVVVGGIVQCNHGGRARLLTGDSRLEVDSHAVLVQGQEVHVSFAPSAPGLLTPCPHTSGTHASPCTATLAATTGISSKLTIGTLGILLDSARGQTTNANDPSATWSIANAGQSKLAADG